jgi:hypothetical protein
LASAGTTWLIAGSEDFPFNRDFHWSLARTFRSERVFAGTDGKVVVYRIEGGAVRTDGR